MSLQSKYTEEQKAMALAYYTACGENQRKTARDCNIPLATLQFWLNGGAVNDEVTEKSVALKGDIADLFENELRSALYEAKAKREEASYAQLMTGAAIATDKMRLLREQATETQRLKINVEYVDTTPDDRAHADPDAAEAPRGAEGNQE